MGDNVLALILSPERFPGVKEVKRSVGLCGEEWCEKCCEKMEIKCRGGLRFNTAVN